MYARFLPLPLLVFAPALLADGSSFVAAPIQDTFDDGQNHGGWSYNPDDAIEATGGSPGGWLHQATAITFAPIFISSAKEYSGDFRAGGVSKISFDARLDTQEWGTGAGFNMSVLLRDSKGTSDPADDDYAYFVGPEIPLEGTGWKHFDFPIPSQDTSAVPAGWKGGWAGDLESFRPGIDWNDVITNVDQVEIWFMNPSFFAIIQLWDIGLDNILMEADGQAAVRNGSGANPLGFAQVGTPNIGGTWDTTVDIATPGHVVSVVAISTGGASSGFFPGGSVVGEILLQPEVIVDVQAGSHSMPIPNDPALIGVCVATQGATVSLAGAIHMNNALDVVIGS